MTPPDARAALDALNRVLNYCCFDDQDFENTKEDRELIRAALTQMIDGGWNSDMDAAPRDGSDVRVIVGRETIVTWDVRDKRWALPNGMTAEPIGWKLPITPAGEQS